MENFILWVMLCVLVGEGLQVPGFHPQGGAAHIPPRCLTQREAGAGQSGGRGRGADAISDLDVCALCRQHRKGESQVAEPPAPWTSQQSVASKGRASPGSGLCTRQ